MSRAPRAASFVSAVARPLAAIALLASVACSGTSTADPLIPSTGVLVKAESIVGSQGCGRGPTQVHKYVAVAVDSRGAALAGNVYDCFADAQFDLLPPTELAVQVDLRVFAYSAEAYEQQKAAVDASVNDIAALERDTRATWTTKCTAIQQADIQVLARCDRLAAGTGGTSPAQAVIELPTDSFATHDGGALTCGTDYTTVRVRFGTAGVFAETGSITCPAPVSLTVPAPASYSLEVALFSAAGVPIALRTCAATTSPGLAARVVCN